MLLLRIKAACNHCSGATPESGEEDHQNMNEEEKNQRHGSEEVNGSRRLLAAGEINETGKRGRDGGGHCQAGPDQQREQTEYNEHVGESLEQVIGPAILFNRRLEVQMMRD